MGIIYKAYRFFTLCFSAIQRNYNYCQNSQQIVVIFKMTAYTTLMHYSFETL